MKKKNKLIALVEIAIVLCSVFLVASPATGIATDQNVQQEMQKVITSEVTTASEDDYILEIYGNANEDDTIDVLDLTHTARIICLLEDKTALADANYDGKVNMLDITQIGLIILGTESKLTLVDSADRDVTVNKPVERVVLAYWMDPAMTLKALNAEDTVVGVTEVIVNEPILFPELSQLPSVGVVYSPDYETLIGLEPDVVLTGGVTLDSTVHEEIQNTIQSLNPDIVVLRFEYRYPPSYADEVRKLGYIFDREEEAEEYINFFEGHLNTIEETVSDIPSDERTRVYFEICAEYMDYWTGGEGTPYQIQIEMAGGNNIFSDIEGYLMPAGVEDVIYRDPEVTFHLACAGIPTGYSVDDVSGLRDKWIDITNRTDGFATISAVQDGRVYTSSMHLSTSLYFVGVPYYAKWFYPEEFGDLNPNAIHQEFLDRFLRIDFDLDEHGVFVYHPKQHPEGR